MGIKVVAICCLMLAGVHAADRSGNKRQDVPQEQGRTLGPILTGLAGAALGLVGDPDVLAAATGGGGGYGGVDPSGLGGLGALSSPYQNPYNNPYGGYGNRYDNRYGNGIYASPISNYGNRYGNGIYSSPYPNRYQNSIYQQSPLTQLLGGYNGYNRPQVGFNSGYNNAYADPFNQIAALLGQRLGNNLRPYLG